MAKDFIYYSVIYYSGDTSFKERMARFIRTSERINEFGTWKSGWDLGRGDSIRAAAVQSAQRVLELAFSKGLWQSNAFPSPSGSILLAFTVGTHDVEIGVEGDETFDITYERDSAVVTREDEIDLPELRLKLLEIIDTICMSASSTQPTTTQKPVVSEALHLSLHPTEVSRFFAQDAAKQKVDQSVSISQNITLPLQGPLQFSGCSQRVSSQQKQLAA